MNDDVGACPRDRLAHRLHARHIQLGPGQRGDVMFRTKYATRSLPCCPPAPVMTILIRRALPSQPDWSDGKSHPVCFATIPRGSRTIARFAQCRVQTGMPDSTRAASGFYPNRSHNAGHAPTGQGQTRSARPACPAPAKCGERASGSFFRCSPRRCISPPEPPPQLPSRPRNSGRVHAANRARSGRRRIREAASLGDEGRNQPLRKLERSVVIPAAGDDHGEAVRFEVRAGKQIRPRLACRVRTVGLKRRRLRKEPLRPKRTVHLVGGNLNKPGDALPLCCFQQHLRAKNICSDEALRVRNAAVNVGFWRQNARPYRSALLPSPWRQSPHRQYHRKRNDSAAPLPDRPGLRILPA